MENFAFITHPEHEWEFAENFFAARFLPRFLISKIMKVYPPSRLLDVRGVASRHNRVSGWIISSPLSTDMIIHDKSHTVKKVLAACRAASRLGAKIIGLGKEFSLIEGLAETITKEMAIPVTTGNSYRINALIEGLKMAAATRRFEIDQVNILITGAASNLGKMCASIVADEVQRLTLFDNNKKQIEKIASQILYDSGLVVRIGETIESSVKEADIIIAANELPEFDSGCFKPGTIVFDIFSAVKKGLAKTTNNRNDVMVIKKIYTMVTGGAYFNKDTGLPKDMIDSEMAEVLLLSLEGRYSSLNSIQTLKDMRVEYIKKIAQKHDFKVSGFLINVREEGIKSKLSGQIIIPGTT